MEESVAQYAFVRGWPRAGAKRAADYGDMEMRLANATVLLEETLSKIWNSLFPTYITPCEFVNSSALFGRNAFIAKESGLGDAGNISVGYETVYA